MNTYQNNQFSRPYFRFFAKKKKKSIAVKVEACKGGARSGKRKARKFSENSQIIKFARRGGGAFLSTYKTHDLTFVSLHPPIK